MVREAYTHPYIAHVVKFVFKVPAISLPIFSGRNIVYRKFVMCPLFVVY